MDKEAQMTTEFKELSERIRLHSQKYILPLYRKDELGNLKFEATLTLVTYKDRFFALTAAHAIDENKLQYGLFVNGEEISHLAKITILKELDLAILDFNFFQFKNRLYFDLNNDPDYSLYSQNAFSWNGFPAKKAKNFNKKNPDKMIQDSLNGNLITTAKTLFSVIKFDEAFSPDSDKIVGFADLNNVEYVKEGKKDKGYLLKGMSGGVLCLHKKEIFPIENFLLFIGIGLEHYYYSDNKVVGLSRKKIINELDKLIAINEPMEFTFLLSPSYTLQPILDFVIFVQTNQKPQDNDALMEWIYQGLHQVLENLKYLDPIKEIPNLVNLTRDKLNNEQIDFLVEILKSMEISSLEKEKFISSLIQQA